MKRLLSNVGYAAVIVLFVAVIWFCVRMVPTEHGTGSYKSHYRQVDLNKWR